MIKKNFILLIAMCFAFNSFAQTNINPESFDITKVGQNVPDFSFTTIDGKTFKISDFKGKTLHLIFFATWCSPCMEEMPLIESGIWKKFKSKNFQVVAFGRGHTVEQLKKFNETKGFTFIIAEDPDKKIYERFFTKYIPRNVLVNKTGKIIYQKQGYSEEEAKVLSELIEKETKL